MGRALGPEATIVSMPVPSAPAPHGCFGLGGDLSLGGAGGDGRNGRVDPVLGDFVGIADHSLLGRRFAGAEVAHGRLHVQPCHAGQRLAERHEEVIPDRPAAGDAHPAHACWAG